MSEQKKGLWGGRFEEQLSDASVALSESISFDYKLYEHDIRASIAHARMLKNQGILEAAQFDNIEKGLQQVRSEIAADRLTFDARLEDIHTHIEKRLTEIIGDDGKRLHTGRSRNDQVAVDTHLYVREVCAGQQAALQKLLAAILKQAEQHKESLWAGYTHTQIAQPILLAHYLLAYFWKFKRDIETLGWVHEQAGQSPLGAGAMAGANYSIDRRQTAKELGFTGVYENSMDAVSNRDYLLNYMFFAARFFTHVSRLCEDLILYSTYEFGYVKMSDAVTTGSSIMPQKKNADICELLRGKAAKAISNLQALFVNLKGLPLTYNRDLQEDKIYLFDTVHQVGLAISAITDVIEGCTFYPEKISANLEKGFAQATDVADYLVAHYKVPFREAHELTGGLVLYCEKKYKTIGELSAAEIKEALQNKYEIEPEALSLQSCIERKQGEGSTSYVEVEAQLKKAQQVLA